MTPSGAAADPPDPAPGRPDACESLARRFAEVAEVAADARARLGRLGDGVDDSVWRGPAARSFRESMAALPGRLAELGESHERASEALAGFAGTLRALQREAGVTLGSGRMARDDLQRAEQARDAAVAGPPAEAAVAEARRRLAQALDQVDEIAARRRRAEAQCVSRLDEAGERGAPGGLRGLVVVTLRAIGEACDALAFVLTVVVVVVVAVALLSNPWGWAATLALLSQLLTAMTWAGGVALAAKAGRRVAGDTGVTWPGLALELVLMFGPAKAGRYLGAFAEADRAAVALVRAGQVAGRDRVGSLAAGPRLVRAAAGRATVAFRVVRRDLPLRTTSGQLVEAVPDLSVNVVMATRWGMENPGRIGTLSAAAALPPPAAALAALGPEARRLAVAWAPLVRRVSWPVGRSR